MGTRGFISFIIDGEEKTAYNHLDSYPEELGLRVLRWAQGADREKAAALARALRVVSPNEAPTPADLVQLLDYYAPDVGGEVEWPTWYQLLHGTQGDPAAILHAGAVEDASGFPANSLFAEWGYVLDFDTAVFEVYAGFQRAPHTDGRFASRKPAEEDFFPVRLVASWPWDCLPEPTAFLDGVKRSVHQR